jgi:glycosyltransferase involved in cell wall biosynthesis
MKMKIAVDGYELGREAKGVGRVIDNILGPLVDLLPEDEFVIYTKESIGKYSRPRASERVLPSSGGYLRWQNGPLRRALKEVKPDVLIATNYTLPLFNPWDSILFEYDLSVISHPEWYTRKYALPRRYLIKRSLKKARLVITSSEFVKKEIQAFFDLSPEKIKVIGFGVEDKFRRVPQEKIVAWKEKKGLAGKKIIGYLGSLFERRHVPALVQAVGLLRQEFPETMLYVVGRGLSGLRPGEMAGILSREWVRWEEVLPEEELPLFYSGLDAFACLSEYEGFGFPPLEALACGTAVVLMRGSSLEEVFGDTAVLVGNPDEREVMEALRTVLADEGIRLKLLNRFEQKRAQFSWQRASRELAFLLGVGRSK